MCFSFLKGLLKTGDKEAGKMALTIARRYTTGTMFSCPEDAEVCNMFEKVIIQLICFNQENSFEKSK
jgi:hypothetical protein